MAKCKTSPEVGGMGHSVKRKEDPRFIRGQGNYVDDVVRPGMVFMDIVRSPYAHAKIKSINDERLREFDKCLHSVLLNLAKRIAADGEGASKFISVKVLNAKTFLDAKKVAFSIANSPLVKTAIAGEDPNWGRVIMAIGKAGADLNVSKLAINFGNIKIIEKGQLFSDYEEVEVAEYMRGEKIDLTVDLNIGNKNFTAYTMDLTKKYIEINADYRS